MSILIGLAHEPLFNTAWPSAGSFRTKPKLFIFCGESAFSLSLGFLCAYNALID